MGWFNRVNDIRVKAHAKICGVFGLCKVLDFHIK